MIILIILLVLCAFFTASEMAFLGCDWVKIKNKMENQKGRRTMIKEALKSLYNQDRFLSTVLIGTNITIVAISLISSKYWHNKAPDWYISLVCTIIIFLLGEILPKSLVSGYKEKFFVLVAPVYSVLYWVFYPFIFLSYQTSAGILKLFKSQSSPLKQKFTKEEFRLATRKFFSLREQGLILRLFEFEEKTVKDIMLPRNKIIASDINFTIQELQKTVSKTGHSRIPIYEKTLDNVLGYIIAKDLLTTESISRIIRKCIFIRDSQKINELFDELKPDAKNLMVVKNADGKTVGIITTEDIIEELFGEIEDEYDRIE